MDARLKFSRLIGVLCAGEELGARCLVALAATDQDQAIADYAGLGIETARAVADLLEDTRVDADGFWREVATRLAGWRRAAGLPA
ncbi:MAG: hypothetical protein HYY78_05765 [Betaproteobacteria bacterium]|nr:hypothetical protein [Betaproteobacteria bacterium]